MAWCECHIVPVKYNLLGICHSGCLIYIVYRIIFPFVWCEGNLIYLRLILNFLFQYLDKLYLILLWPNYMLVLPSFMQPIDIIKTSIHASDMLSIFLQGKKRSVRLHDGSFGNVEVITIKVFELTLSAWRHELKFPSNQHERRQPQIHMYAWLQVVLSRVFFTIHTITVQSTCRYLSLNLYSAHHRKKSYFNNELWEI